MKAGELFVSDEVKNAADKYVAETMTDFDDEESIAARRDAFIAGAAFVTLK